MQLEAIVYGCQRHLQDLPMKPEDEEQELQDKVHMQDNVQNSGVDILLKKQKNQAESSDIRSESKPKSVSKPERCGFLLGDGAG